MAVENRSAARLLGSLLGPLSRGSLQQKRSYLEGSSASRSGRALHLADDPLVPRGFGSRLFDSEGIGGAAFPVFRAGALRNYYVDNYYGRKLGMAPTTRGSSNLAWKLGDEGRSRAPRRHGRGHPRHRLPGRATPTAPPVTSRTACRAPGPGRQRAEPIGEMNISGNHLELWKHLAAVGNDPYPYSSLRTPTLVFEGVQFAGT